MINPSAHWKKIACLGLAGGFALGFFIAGKQEPIVQTQLVEDTQSKALLAESMKTEQQLRERLLSAEKTISELKVNTKERVRIVYQKDGTKTVERVKSVDVSHSVDHQQTSTEVKQEQRQTVEDRVVQSDAKTSVKASTVSMPKDRFYLGLSAGISRNGLSDPGLQFKYRFLDLGKASFWASAELIEPTNPQPRLGLGISF